MAARVVDLPEPVGPVTSTSPFFSLVMRRTPSGSPRSSAERILLGMMRNTAAMPRCCMRILPRKRARPGNRVGEVQVLRLLEMGLLLLGQDLEQDRLQFVMGQELEILADHIAMEPEYGRMIRRKGEDRKPPVPSSF